jgi:glutaredoxin
VDRTLREDPLRPGGDPDEFFRTEAGILAVAGPRDATLFTRNGCHLCDEAKRVILPLLFEFGGILREVDIDRDSELQARYANEVPVIFLGARKAAKHRVDPAQFRRQLAFAGR